MEIKHLWAGDAIWTDGTEGQGEVKVYRDGNLIQHAWYKQLKAPYTPACVPDGEVKVWDEQGNLKEDVYRDNGYLIMRRRLQDKWVADENDDGEEHLEKKGHWNKAWGIGALDFGDNVPLRSEFKKGYILADWHGEGTAKYFKD